MLMYQLLNKPAPEVPLNGDVSVFVDPTTHVGIEIEVENTSSSISERLPSWTRVADGSVSGFELVLSQPTAGDDLFCAINELSGISFSEEAFSQRTSVHVHVDIRSMTFDQLINFITIATMFEPVLYKYVAPHRNNNHFCWPLSECQGIITRLLKVIHAHNNGQELRPLLDSYLPMNHVKYAGINLSSIKRFGSLEFRMHEGTADVPTIIRWVNILLSMRDYAMHPDRTPLNILETKQDEGIESIFTTILGGYTGVLTYDGVEEDILKGIRVAQDFVQEMRPRPNIVVPRTDTTLIDNYRGS